MKRTAKMVAASVLAMSLLGGTQAWASSASLSRDGLKNSNGGLMVDVTTFAGLGDDGSSDAPRPIATFRAPSALLIKEDGTMLVSDTRNHLLRSVQGDQVGTFAGIIPWKDSKGQPVGTRLDGKAELSIFQEPMGLASDAGGNVYVADAGNHAIRKIDAAGNVTTIAGNGLIGRKDGKGPDATFDHPQDVAVAADGTVYVADTLNHVIRSIRTDGSTSTLTAPSDRLIEVTPGQVVNAGDYLDGDIAQAKFNEPAGLVLDAKGNLYVSDSGNQRIRYMDFSTGKVTTVAGANEAAAGQLYNKQDLYAPGSFADGDAGKAQFNFPQGIALTPEGGLVIADSMNHSIRYLLDGKVTTLAGDRHQQTGETDGVEYGAAFLKPMDVAISTDGSLYVADAFNNKVRKLNAYQLPPSLPQDDRIKVVVGSNVIAFDAQPEIVNGRTMVPVRAITEALGYTVGFREEDRSVQLTKGDVTIELSIDKTGIQRLEKNKQPLSKTMDVSPYVKEDRTYVPVRFFAEEIGMDVQWDDATRTAILRPATNIIK
ncbi:stalk domain-containing protein [Paenibacillus rigui]|uniref:Copper amine oxidase n=1 Tax=Paenibacillus rigui TaxID=554312 RepID=A0A229UL26_9BACL|nr:stalk domain-containing protein [Paenibacillus rigui]OXM84110.1 copper amine oxidase [Paenibacillus rigui]